MVDDFDDLRTNLILPSAKVNNAAMGAFGPATKATKEDLDRTFGANVYAPLFMIQAVVPVMPRGGRVINIGSIASKLGVAPIPLYVASKAALDALTFAMAMEVSSYPRSGSARHGFEARTLFRDSG